MVHHFIKYVTYFTAISGCWPVFVPPCTTDVHMNINHVHVTKKLRTEFFYIRATKFFGYITLDIKLSTSIIIITLAREAGRGLQ